MRRQFVITSDGFFLSQNQLHMSVNQLTTIINTVGVIIECNFTGCCLRHISSLIIDFRRVCDIFRLLFAQSTTNQTRMCAKWTKKWINFAPIYHTISSYLRFIWFLSHRCKDNTKNSTESQFLRSTNTMKSSSHRFFPLLYSPLSVSFLHFNGIDNHRKIFTAKASNTWCGVAVKSREIQ